MLPHAPLPNPKQNWLGYLGDVLKGTEGKAARVWAAQPTDETIRTVDAARCCGSSYLRRRLLSLTSFQLRSVTVALMDTGAHFVCTLLMTDGRNPTHDSFIAP